MMPITMKQLEAFHAVMSAGGVTRAAEQIGVSQPAISRIIADFETSVGFPLFLRATRNMLPTARARTLHAEVERAFLGLNHIEMIVSALRERGEGQLRLGVVPSLLPMVSGELIAPFSRLHPAASISIEVVATLNAIDWVSFRQTDLGVTFESLSGPGIETSRIGRTEAACIVASGHRLTTLGRPIRARDLQGEVFISYKPDSGFRTEVDRLFLADGIERDLRFEARTTAGVCELVAALGGVAIVPSPGPQLSADARLALVSFRPRIMSDVVLVQPTGGALSPLARAFAAFAKGRKIDFLADLKGAGKQLQGNGL